MNHFPATNSNLSAEHIGLFLQENYSVGSELKCRLIKAGINDTYLVEDSSNKFIFRVYSFNWRSKLEIQEEIKLLNLLKENNVSVSFPISDNTGNFIQSLNAPEGNRFAVLFSYAAGEKQPVVSNESHYEIGKLVAQFHKITVDQNLSRVEYTPEVILVDSLQKVAEFLNPESEEFEFMCSAQKQLIAVFKTADTSSIRKGIVHLDIWFDNLNITSEGEATIFDFDFCGNGWLCLDIAYYILQIHNVEKYEKSDFQPRVDSFLKGYESVTSISEEEKRLIPALGVSLYFFYLGVQCQRYENWSNSFLNENYLKRFVNGLVKRYYDMYELGTDLQIPKQ